MRRVCKLRGSVYSYAVGLVREGYQEEGVSLGGADNGVSIKAKTQLLLPRKRKEAKIGFF